MADKKITDYTEKLTIVDDDLIEIIDSEEIVISEKNKKVKFENIGLLESNTWYVNPSASGGNGSPQKPFTVNEAMAAASENDIIIFQRGTYTDDITVTKDNLTFVGYNQNKCKIEVTNFVIDTNAQQIFLFIENLSVTSPGITQGTNLALIIFRNCIGDFNGSIVIDLVAIYDSHFGITGNLTTKGAITLRNTRILCTTLTIEGLGTFYNSIIQADISAAGETVTLYNCNVDGDVDCAILNINNTVITGTRIGTSSTTVNNQENFGPGTSINNAAVLVLNGTPQAIKAAEGADVILIPQQILIRHNFVSAAFATNTTLQIGVGSVYIDLTTSVLTAGSTQIDIEDISGLFANISANQAINIKVKTGNPSAGGGSLDVWVIYKRIDVS